MKIKVKTLLLLSCFMIFIIVIVIPFGALQIAKYLDEKDSDKAVIFYENYLSRSILPRSNEAYYKYAVNLAGDADKYSIMMRTQGGELTTASQEDIEKAQKLLGNILEDSPDDKYYDLAYSKIMDLSIVTGKPDNLLEWIEWGSHNEGVEIKYISDLYKCFYYYVNREFDLANGILDSYNETNQIIDWRYDLIKGKVEFAQGEADLAKQYNESEEYINSNTSSTLFGSNTFEGRKIWYQKYENQFKGEYKVKGKVTFNGEPIPFVEVYIKNYDNTSNIDGFVGITDINGEYETVGLRSGRYEIGIGLSNSLLYDKVYLMQNIEFLDIQSDTEFNYSFRSPLKITKPENGAVINGDHFTVEWEPVEGAQYYEVQTVSFSNPIDMTGGNLRSSIIDTSREDRITDTKAEFDVNILRTSIRGLLFDGEDLIISPNGILGNFIPGLEYPIIVNGFDSNNNLIGSSLPVLSFYDSLSSIKFNGSLTKGEELIANKEYVEAIRYYETELINNSNSEDALLYLSKIYIIGWKKGTQDLNKAMDYATRYSVLKGDNALVLEVIGFMDATMKRDKKQQIREVFNQIPESKRNSDYYLKLGEFYMSIYEFESARNALENISNHIPSSVLYLDLYVEDYDKVLDRLDHGDVDLDRINKNVLRDSIVGLKMEDKNLEEYGYFKEFLQELLSKDLSTTQGQELINKINHKISNPYIISIVDQIKSERYWDEED